MKLSNLRYLRNFAVTALITLSCVALFNLTIDPFGLFQLVHIEGINYLRPAYAQNALLSKAAAVRAVKPEAIILGTSRANQGYNPDHPGWDRQQSPRYNLATPGASVYREYRYFQHARTIHPLKQVVLSLDWFSFDSHRGDRDFENFLIVDKNYQPTPFAIWKQVGIPSLISFNAIQASLKTIQRQDLSKELVTYLPNGFQYKLGRSIQQRRQYLETCKNMAQYNYQMDDPTRSGNLFDALRALLTESYQNQIDVRILLSPIHVYLLETLFYKEEWQELEAWMQAVVTINEEIAQSQNAQPYPVWNFIGYGAPNTQVIPTEKTANSDDLLYFEGMHFKQALGDLVLDQVWNYHPPDRPPIDGFGVQLTSENLTQIFQTIRANHAVYQADHQQEIRDIQRAIRPFLNRPNAPSQPNAPD